MTMELYRKSYFDMTDTQREELRRLNWILKFSSPRFDVPRMLAKRDDLVRQILDVLGYEGEAPVPGSALSDATNDLQILAAQRALIDECSTMLSGGQAHLRVKDVIYFMQAVRPDSRFPLGRGSTDLTSLFNLRIVEVFDRLDLKRKDFLKCSNNTCENFHVPLRKPMQGASSYCSPSCAQLAATRAYRNRKKIDSKIAVMKKNKKRK